MCYPLQICGHRCAAVGRIVPVERVYCCTEGFLLMAVYHSFALHRVLATLLDTDRSITGGESPLFGSPMHHARSRRWYLSWLPEPKDAVYALTPTHRRGLRGVRCSCRFLDYGLNVFMAGAFSQSEPMTEAPAVLRDCSTPVHR